VKKIAPASYRIDKEEENNTEFDKVIDIDTGIEPTVNKRSPNAHRNKGLSPRVLIGWKNAAEKRNGYRTPC